MIRLHHRNFSLLALALAGLLADPAAAQNAMPALRANVTVTGDIVRIGDLVENAGPVADVPIFRAPDLGTTRRGADRSHRRRDPAAPAHRHRHARAFRSDRDPRQPRDHARRKFPRASRKALEGQYGFGEARNILVEFDRDVRTLNVEPTVDRRPAGARARLQSAHHALRRDVRSAVERGAAPAVDALHRHGDRDDRRRHRRSSGRARRGAQGLRSHHRRRPKAEGACRSPTSMRRPGLPRGISCARASRCTTPI